MYERSIFPSLKAHLSDNQVTVITGMRRVGKTTTLKFLLDQIPHSNKLYLDLERLEDRAIFKQENFSEIQADLEVKGLDFSLPTVLVLDEIQLVPEVASFIKYYHDHFQVKFIVSGSSSYYLRNRFTESLAGRKRIFELFPLDFIEFLRFKEIAYNPLLTTKLSSYRRTVYAQFKSQYEEFIQYGGFPEVVLSPSIDRKEGLLSDVLNSYIELDIKLLSDYSVVDDLYRLVSLLAARIGQKMDYSKLGSILGINRHKLKDYIHLLERTYFLHLIKPYSGSIDRAIAKQPKVYLADTGLVNQLAQIEGGAIFENSIALQLKSLGKLNYFQLKTGQEIDFILNEEYAFEVKETPLQKDLNTLTRRAELLKIEKANLIGRYPPKNGFENFIWGGTIF